MNSSDDALHILQGGDHIVLANEAILGYRVSPSLDEEGPLWVITIFTAGLCHTVYVKSQPEAISLIVELDIAMKINKGAPVRLT
jgi:hypothetical protein